MMADAGREAVFVEAPARLHFGVLDLRGDLGRWFGGVGAAAAAPTLLVSGSKSERLEVSGEDPDRASAFAAAVLRYYGISSGVRLEVHRALPPHVGLGSGTQLALAVGRVIGELYGRGGEGADLARAAGRGRRSGIGTYIFDGGGLIVEGGHHQERDGPAPLIVRLPIPASWRAVIAIPDAPAGVSGGAERDAFRNLPPPPPREVERVSHLVLMGLLPAVVEDDLLAFGSALTALQTITGRWFEAAQGGAFAPGPTRELVRSLPEWGALGVGQSSWGPTVYGLVRGEVEGERLAERMREAVGASGCVYQGPLGSDGARVWWRNQSE